MDLDILDCGPKTGKNFRLRTGLGYQKIVETGFASDMDTGEKLLVDDRIRIEETIKPTEVNPRMNDSLQL